VGTSEKMPILTGKIVALDVGDARVGVAASDPTGLLASPVTILKRDAHTIEKVVDLVRELSAGAVLVGLPLNMDGSVGFQAKKVQKFARQIEQAVAPLPVIMEDERESTADARELRLARGTRQKKRRERVDSEAAAIFLQAYLDRTREQRLRGEGGNNG
jgi:putative Holliday junction resolvase